MAKEEKTTLTNLPKVDVQSKLGTITDNLPLLKAQIEKELKPYMGKEVSIENLQDAKKSRADLNRIFNEIDTKRKSIKREWNNPYKSWEEKLKDSISFLTDCINDLDSKIKVTEQKELDIKMDEINNMIEERLILEDESTSNFIREITWFRNDKWSNKGETLTKIEKEINATIDKINQDLSIIVRDTEFYSDLYEEYKKQGDLGSTLALKERLVVEKDRREKLRLELEAKHERERKELEEREAQKRKTEEEILKNSSVDNSNIDIQNNPQQPMGSLFDIQDNEPVEDEEPKSIPLDNTNWEQTEYDNRMEEKEQESIQPIVSEPVEPELTYNSPKSYRKVEVGYLFRTDVATAEYLKKLAIFYGAEVTRIVEPKFIKGDN